MSVQYPLSGRLDYIRRYTSSSIAYAVSVHIAERTKVGEHMQFVNIYHAPHPDGDYVAVILMQDTKGGSYGSFISLPTQPTPDQLNLVAAS